MTPQIPSLFPTISAPSSQNISGDQTSDSAAKFESMLNDAMASKSPSQEASTPTALSSNKQPLPSAQVIDKSAVEKNLSDTLQAIPAAQNTSPLSIFSLMEAQSNITNFNELTTKENLVDSASNVAKSLKEVASNQSLQQDSNSSNAALKNITNEVADAIILGKETVGQPKITKNNELTTKDSLFEPNALNKTQIGSSKERSSKEDVNNNNINAEILLALMSGQQNSQNQVSPNQSTEMSSVAKDETLNLSSKVINQQTKNDLLLNTPNLEKVASIAKEPEALGIDQFIDSAKIQDVLNLGNAPEVSKRLMQIQSKLEGHKEGTLEFESKDSPITVLSQSNIAKQSASSSNSFAFLTKDEKAPLQDDSNKVLGVSANVSSLQFNEHLSKNTAEFNVKEGSNSNPSLPTPFHSPNWGPALNQRVTWMVRDQLQNATLTINPPNLGQIEVRLQTDQAQQTSVYFMSNNPEVRQAISENLSTLRQMMSQSGLQLGQADVGSRDPSGSNQYDSNPNKKGNRSIFATTTINSTEPSHGIGLINTFA